MKAQRRHELKTNTLAEAMSRLPKTGARNAATAVSIVVAGILIGLLIRFRLQGSNDRLARAQDNLAVAREDIDLIKQRTAMGADYSESLEWLKDARSRLDSVLSDVGTSNANLAAEAMVARGDVNWAMAGFNDSTTQPSTDGPSTPDLLQAAQDSYQQVISTYPQQEFSVVAAHMGLAAIAEDRHDWDAARREYQTVADDAKAPDLMQSMAKSEAASVEQLEHPPLIAPVATQPAAAGPAVFGPTTIPSVTK